MTTYSKVTSETAFRFPAKVYNALIDLIGKDAADRLAFGPASGTFFTEGQFITVKNTSTADKVQHQMMELGESLVDAFSYEDNFKRHGAALEAVAAQDPTQPVVILHQPIALDGIRTALYRGIFIAQVTLSDDYAQADGKIFVTSTYDGGSDTTTLVSDTDSGPIRALYLEDGSATDVVWGILDLQQFSAGAAAAQAVNIEIGNGNDLTPVGYGGTTFYGVASIAGHINEVPTAAVPGSPVAGFYADGLTWGTNLQTGGKVWCAARLTDSDANNHVGLDLPFMEGRIVVSSQTFTIDVNGGGTTTIYLLGSS